LVYVVGEIIAEYSQQLEAAKTGNRGGRLLRRSLPHEEELQDFRGFLLRKANGPVTVLTKRISDRPRVHVVCVLVGGRLWWLDMGHPRIMANQVDRIIGPADVGLGMMVTSFDQPSGRLWFSGGRDLGVRQGAYYEIVREGAGVATVVSVTVTAHETMALVVETNTIPRLGDAVRLPDAGAAKR
jgi:hypothetical protein